MSEKDSLNMLEKYRDCIFRKQCYDNVYQVVMAEVWGEESEITGDKSWRVVFGAVKILDEIYVKHCFFMHGDKIVDPTLVSRGEEFISKAEYVVAKKFTVNEYIDELSRTGTTDLDRALRGVWIELDMSLRRNEKCVLTG